MDASIGKFFESVGNFFSGGDQIPWCDRDVISWQDFFDKSLLVCSFANQHQFSAPKEEQLYLLGVGYYQTGDYSRGRQLVEHCLETAPDWRQAVYLKKALEDRIAKDGAIGIGITATAVGIIAAGIAAALAHKN